MSDNLNNIPNHQKNDEPEQNAFKQSNRNQIVSPITAALFGLVGTFVLYQIVGGIITLVIFGFDINNASSNALRLMTMAGQILFILLPALLFAKWFYEDVSFIIRYKIPKPKEIILFSVGMIIIIPLLQNYMFIQNYFITELANKYPLVNSLKETFDSINDMVDKAYEGLLSSGSVIEGFFVIIVVAVVPAICEEVLFRGFIQKSFELKMTKFKAALITASFFGIYHFSPYGLVPLVLLGFYFGFAAYLSGSIFVPIFLHFINNLFAVITYFIFGSNSAVDKALEESIGINQSLISIVILILLITFYLIFIKSRYKIENN